MDHVLTNRRYWDEKLAKWFGGHARSRWSADEPHWGIWAIPQSELPVLPAGVAGLDAVELGCGTGYVSAWLARCGARPVGVDNSARQLATARAMQEEFGLRFPLLHGDAERTPLRDGCADLVISEYGAAVWCDPYRWIPEAARLLRSCGFTVEDLIEVQAPEGATSDFDHIPPEWARRWPSEEVWFARRT